MHLQEAKKKKKVVTKNKSKEIIGIKNEGSCLDFRNMHQRSIIYLQFIVKGEGAQINLPSLLADLEPRASSSKLL